MAHNSQQEARRISVASLVGTAVGTACVVLALTVISWLNFKLDDGGVFTAHQLSDDPSVNGYVSAFCGWLGWLALAATVVACVVVSVPTSQQYGWRLATIALGLAGLALSAVAFIVLDRQVQDLSFLTAGAPLAMAGFLVLAISGGLLPRWR